VPVEGAEDRAPQLDSAMVKSDRNPHTDTLPLSCLLDSTA
jgi:hypothetical protein